MDPFAVLFTHMFICVEGKFQKYEAAQLYPMKQYTEVKQALHIFLHVVVLYFEINLVNFLSLFDEFSVV